ncbi:MAG: hypothetical protein ACFFGZ_06430 [Candidatus Thorarchaeota archaeon]
MTSEDQLYSELAKIWQQERQEKSLVPLAPDFFPRIRGQLDRFRRKAKDPLKDSIMDRIEFMVEDLIALRSEKIQVMVRLEPNHTDIAHLTREERIAAESLGEFILKLRALPKKTDTDISGSSTDSGRRNDRQSEEFKPRSNDIQMTRSSHADELEKPKTSFAPSKELVLVRIIKPVERRFVGTDGFHYGPLAKEDVVFLPYHNEEALVSRGAAIELETGWN